MAKTQADFTYTFSEYGGHKVLAIIDLDTDGRKSVTNDIANVVDVIAERAKIDPRKFIIVYSDSGGMWDGWSAVRTDFVGLRQPTLVDAMAKYMERIGYSLN